MFKLLIIRKGGVSLPNLEHVIAKLGLSERVVVEQLKRDHAKPETENLEAPGQFLRHYSPDISSFLYQGELSADKDISRAIVLDFGKVNASLKSRALHYLDLSESGDLLEAIHNVFDALRWAETNTDAEYVLITDLVHYRE